MIDPIASEGMISAATADAISTLAVAVIGVLAAALTTAITILGRKTSAWLEQRLGSDAYQESVSMLTSVTKSLVLEAERTLVKEAKEASADGKLNKEDAIRIRDEVFKRAKEHLGTVGLEKLQKGLAADLPMVERMIRTHIETRLHETKLERNS